jgi:hypothetical protein
MVSSSRLGGIILTRTILITCLIISFGGRQRRRVGLLGERVMGMIGRVLYFYCMLGWMRRLFAWVGAGADRAFLCPPFFFFSLRALPGVVGVSFFSLPNVPVMPFTA